MPASSRTESTRPCAETAREAEQLVSRAAGHQQSSRGGGGRGVCGGGGGGDGGADWKSVWSRGRGRRGVSRARREVRQEAGRFVQARRTGSSRGWEIRPGSSDGFVKRLGDSSRLVGRVRASERCLGELDRPCKGRVDRVGRDVTAELVLAGRRRESSSVVSGGGGAAKLEAREVGGRRRQRRVAGGGIRMCGSRPDCWRRRRPNRACPRRGRGPRRGARCRRGTGGRAHPTSGRRTTLAIGGRPPRSPRMSSGATW